MRPTRSVLLLAVLALGLAMLACGVTPQIMPSTPIPAAPTARSTRSNFILPTTIPNAGATSVSPRITARPTLKPAASPTSQRAATATPRVAATVAPVLAAPTQAASAPKSAPPITTPDPNLFVITEEDIEQTIAAGAGQDQGLTVKNLQVRFADDKMTLSADELTFGPVQVRGLVLVGRLSAQNGQLQFQAESVSPSGLVTSMLPVLANQALARYASNWYVEEVHTRNGRLELRIRQ